MTAYRLAAWLLLSQALLLGDGPESGRQAPVPLFTPPLRTPLEAAGTGLAPEVTVEVTIDATGRVGSVDILSIRPSSDYDGIFAEVTRQTVSRWRYAPATRQGEPVETTLTWMVQFPTIEERTRSGDLNTDLAWRQVDAGERRMRSLRERILALSIEQRVKVLEENATIARACMSGRDVKRFDSPRFVVFTNGPSADVAEKLARNLEATFNTLRDLLGELVEPQPERYRIFAFMYESRSEFEALKSRIEAVEWSSGFYNPAGMLAFHMEMPSNQALLNVMLHEATHAYLDRYLSRPGVVFPRWLDEGLAEYVGNSEIKKGELVPGRTRRSEVYVGRGSPALGVSGARLTVQAIQQAVRKGEALKLRALVGADLDAFYGEQRDLYYPMSWLLIHFLRHGREEWTDERFSTLVLYVAEGYSPTQAFTAVYGDPVALERDFVEYIKGF